MGGPCVSPTTQVNGREWLFPGDPAGDPRASAVVPSADLARGSGGPPLGARSGPKGRRWLAAPYGQMRQRATPNGGPEPRAWAADGPECARNKGLRSEAGAVRTAFRGRPSRMAESTKTPPRFDNCGDGLGNTHGRVGRRATRPSLWRPNRGPSSGALRCLAGWAVRRVGESARERG